MQAVKKPFLLLLFFTTLFFAPGQEAAAQPPMEYTYPCTTYSGDGYVSAEIVRDFLEKFPGKSLKICTSRLIAPGLDSPRWYYAITQTHMNNVCQTSEELMALRGTPQGLEWMPTTRTEVQAPFRPQVRYALSDKGVCPLAGHASYIPVEGVSPEDFRAISAFWLGVTTSEARFEIARNGLGSTLTLERFRQFISENEPSLHILGITFSNGRFSFQADHPGTRDIFILELERVGEGFKFTHFSSGVY